MSRRQWRSRTRDGFTFVELVVALVVLVVGLLGLSATASVLATQLRIARLETLVRLKAEAELEALLARGADLQASGPQEHDGLFATTLEVGGKDPRIIRVTVVGGVGSDTVTDTLVTLVRSR